jgi:hypothetical protein
VCIILVVGSQEQDRHPRGARTIADQACNLVAVKPRHLHVKENDGEVLLQDMAQGGLAGIGRDDLEPGRAQHFLSGHEVPGIVIDHQDLREDALRRSVSRPWRELAWACLHQPSIFHHHLGPVLRTSSGMTFLSAAWQLNLS